MANAHHTPLSASGLWTTNMNQARTSEQSVASSKGIALVIPGDLLTSGGKLLGYLKVSAISKGE